MHGVVVTGQLARCRVARQPVRVRAEAEGKVTEGEKKSDGTFYNDENPVRAARALFRFEITNADNSA